MIIFDEHPAFHQFAVRGELFEQALGIAGDALFLIGDDHQDVELLAVLRIGRHCEARGGERPHSPDERAAVHIPSHLNLPWPAVPKCDPRRFGKEAPRTDCVRI